MYRKCAKNLMLTTLVSDGINKYSVPYDLIGKTVSIRVTRDMVEVFFQDNRVAVHVRERAAKRDAIIKSSHMPEKHRQYLTYTKEDFLSWAAGVGPYTEKVVHHFLESGKAPEQGFKYCVSLRNYGNTYKNERIEDACRQILTFSGEPSIRGISILLKSTVTDKTKHTPPTGTTAAHRSRGITRGAAQFRKGGGLQ